MANFFKVFGLGVLYVVTFPLMVLLLALYAAYCLIMFIYMGVRSIISFFSGGTPMGDMKEDVEAKRILLARKMKEEAIENILISPNSQFGYQQNISQPEANTPIQEETKPEDDVFPDTYEDKEETSVDGDNNDDFAS